MAASEKIASVVSPAELLDAITLGTYPDAGSHAAIMELWNTNPEHFLPHGDRVGCRRRFSV